MKRAAQVTVEVLSGEDILVQAFELARHLWNYARYLNKQHWLEAAANGGRKYIGRYQLDKELRKHWSYQELSDRIGSYTVKDFDIAMRSFFSNRKNWNEAMAAGTGCAEEKPKPPRYCEHGRTLTFEIGRNAKPIGNFEYRLTALGACRPERHVTVRIHVQPGVKMEPVKLIRISSQQAKRGWYHGSINLNLSDPECPERPRRHAAIDLGVTNLGALAFENGDTILYDGGALLDVYRLSEKRASKCKPSGWAPGKSRLPPSQRNISYKNKGSDTGRLAIHNFTTSVIRECLKRGVTVLAVGKLTGIRKDKDFGKEMNQKLHRWPQLEIRRQLKYKGEDASIEVVEISERGTSRTCAQCGRERRKNRVKRGLYRCDQCGLVVNADVNGALNILNRIVNVSAEAVAEVVGGVLPAPPSLAVVAPGTGEPALVSQIYPIFTAKFDLRNWSVVVTQQTVSELDCDNYGLWSEGSVAVEDLEDSRL